MRKTILLLLAALALSLALNWILFTYSKQYYLHLNGTRLDPTGTGIFSDSRAAQGPADPQAAAVVLFGDSRAAQWPAPSVDGYHFINLGTGAQTSTQALLRFQAQVTPLQPDLIVVQLCINDLKTIPLFPQHKEAIIATCKENLDQILEYAADSDTAVILTTVFPVGQVPLQRKFFWSDEVAAAVVEVNAYIDTLASDQVVIFDAFTILAGDTGQLRPAYSRDELHLNQAGYDALNRSFSQLLTALR